MKEDLISPEVWELLQPGQSVRVYYEPGHVRNQLRHILAIVDEDEIVYKVWNKKRQYWDYHTEWIYGFQLLWKDGHLTTP